MLDMRFQAPNASSAFCLGCKPHTHSSVHARRMLICNASFDTGFSSQESSSRAKSDNKRQYSSTLSQHICHPAAMRVKSPRQVSAKSTTCV